MDILTKVVWIVVMVGMVIGVMIVATYDMKNRIVKTIIILLAALAACVALVCAWHFDYQNDIKKWNNGICMECEEDLQLMATEYFDRSYHYYYSCKNSHCVKTTNPFEK